MIKYTWLISCIFLGTLTFAQPGWKWPEDPEQEKMAKEKEAYYKVQMQLDNYEGALTSLNYLYAHTPDLNESIYINGVKVIDEILETEKSETRRKRLEDSILWTFDMRVKYFDEDEAAIDRKAYTAFKMYYKTPAKYKLLRALYQQLYSFDASKISDFNLTPYMTLTNYYYKTNPDEMPAEDVLDIHQTITSVIDQKIANGGDPEKLQKEQDKVDAFLTALPDILSCAFIEQHLVPKFKTDPTNLNLAKKIFSYSLKAKCTDKPYFTLAGEVLLKENPTFELAKALADRFYSIGEYTKALQYYDQALKLARTTDQKFDTWMGKASIQIKLGDKPKARSFAYEALSIKPGAKDAYNLIGNLYYTSYNECKKGENKIKDRSVFWAAYDMYQKAGNTEQMEASKEQFPSIEEIFSDETYEEGQSITVNCWINETVVIRRR